MKIKIGIVDDHPTVNRGVAGLIAEDPVFDLAFIASDRAGLLDKLAVFPPDILLADLIMPDISGFELIEEIRNLYPEIKIVLYTRISDPIVIDHAISIGTFGLILKTQPEKELMQAIKDVAKGKVYLPKHYKHYLNVRFPKDMLKLSARETEIIELISHGISSKEISESLGISLKTVEKHRANLFQKFRVNNVVELIRASFMMGLIK